MWHWYNTEIWGMSSFWWIFWVIVLWVLMTPGGAHAQAKKDSPLDVLKKRFAAGLINKQEYEEKKKILQKH